MAVPPRSNDAGYGIVVVTEIAWILADGIPFFDEQIFVPRVSMDQRDPYSGPGMACVMRGLSVDSAQNRVLMPSRGPTLSKPVSCAFPSTD